MRIWLEHAEISEGAVFRRFLTEQFRHTGVDGRKNCFEITETDAIANFSQANRFVQALKDIRCKFALDEFGTGLSSFGCLEHFPVDFLKIDGIFKLRNPQRLWMRLRILSGNPSKPAF